MNRAWIPAGALAGVSVAGLLALGPLTDSLTQPVTFSASAASTQPLAQPPAVVAVSINLGQKGQTATKQQAALHSRGGRVSDSTSSEGLVSAKVRPAHTAAATTSTVTAHTTVTPPAKPKKKTIKRQTIIGDIGESNPDSGFAGAGNTKTSVGEQSSTPGSTRTP